MRTLWVAIAWIAVTPAMLRADEPLAGATPAAAPQVAADVLPLLKDRCVKCHGPAKQEGGLRLNTTANLVRGGENGTVVEPGDLDGSLLWHRVDADEMPPDDPLSPAEKDVLRGWISAGAPGLPSANEGAPSGAATSDHWAFAPLAAPALPEVSDAAAASTEIDRFIVAALEKRGLARNPQADRPTLVRRVAFDLTGLPPTPEEIAAFVSDAEPAAYERMVERYLASPHYGERWGKYWLDAAGYADSNGYFNADSDRPSAYRYRDYVVRALNVDMPLDRFIVEQLAGDELANFTAGTDATPQQIALLEATHFLRNGQDGSGESDGNADEVRIDRYSALEATSQIVASSLLGLTMQCAKCHDHKFEPISQRDYYQLQSVFYPAFNHQDWLKPNERFVYASLPGELPRWEANSQRIDEEIAALRADFVRWARDNRPPSTVLLHEEFEDSGPGFAEHFSNTAPGDDGPGGAPPVELDAAAAPCAQRAGGTLRILESGAPGDRWLSTRQPFDWTPDGEGEWIQATFDLVADRVDEGATPAARIGYLLALVDFDDNGTAGGNVLIDGNPAGGAAVHTDYPGADTAPAGDLGAADYKPGHNYGVRVVNIGKGKFRLEHLYDGLPEEKTLELAAADLPDGGFGFEYCCGRSFVVDNLLIERSVPGTRLDDNGALRARQNELSAAIKAKQGARGEKPGKIACVFERSNQPPEVHLLVRGDYGNPGEPVKPAPLSALAEAGETLAGKPLPAPASDADAQASVALAAAPSEARRQAALWPFAADSPFNTALGSRANFREIQSPVYSSEGGASLNVTDWSIPVYVAAEDDPVRNFYRRGNPTPVASIRVPAGAQPDPQDDGTLVIVDPVAKVAAEMWQARRLPNGDWEASATTRTDVTDKGVYDTYHGVRAGGMSVLAGLIRRDELVKRHIPHALAVAVRPKGLNKRGPGGNAFAWPASWADGTDVAGAIYGDTGNLYMGSLLAIPPDVRIDKLGLSPQGLAIAQALQDYGAYICDTGDANVAYYAEPACAPDLTTSARELGRLTPYLRVVANNGPASVGGGGVPRREEAPPFAHQPSSMRRLQWARWLVRPGSRQAALVARVQANRIWQHHFGTGIVATSENLGTSGAPASHPELLEHLAARLIESGWSEKALHREILRSAVYRQASGPSQQAEDLDPANRLLWSFPLRRLDAEALRDAMLAVSGQLDEAFGGPYVATERNAQGEVVVQAAAGTARRSLYLQQRRTQTLSFLSVFDSPTIVFNCVQRPMSTIPLQSLSLLNSEFVVAHAGHFAERLLRETPGEPATRVRRAFVLATAREPAEAELQTALDFCERQQAGYESAHDAAAERKCWTDFCQLLLASNAFLYVE